MNVLLIEDNKGDQVIMQEAFAEAQVNCQLHIVKDGVEAMEFLNRQNQYKDAPRPNLILLDLNLPRKNGREVLAEVKGDPKLAHIPLLVLSNSHSPTDICECYSLKANAYLGKPSRFQDFVDLAMIIKTFWLKLVYDCSH